MITKIELEKLEINELEEIISLCNETIAQKLGNWVEIDSGSAQYKNTIFKWSKVLPNGIKFDEKLQKHFLNLSHKESVDFFEEKSEKLGWQYV